MDGERPPWRQNICERSRQSLLVVQPRLMGFVTIDFQWLTHLIINEGCKGKEIEKIGEESPDIGIAVLAQTLVVEPINLRDLPRFVIAAQNGDTVPVSEFECDKQSDGFD
jgi:hypothetical protein